NDGETAPTPAAAAGRGTKRLDQVGDRARTVSRDVGFAELQHRRCWAVHRASQTRGRDDDLASVNRRVVGFTRFDRGLSRCSDLRLGCRIYLKSACNVTELVARSTL